MTTFCFDNAILTEDDLKGIFDMHYKSILMYANRFLSSKAECEDLIQDVFVHIWEKQMVFPDEISLKIYLYTATRNKCYNIIKHNKVKNNYLDASFQSLEDDNLFLKQILEEEIARQLQQAIEKLPERKKEVLKLSLKGLKNNEIAERLDIKLQTVKTLKSQSYKILRAQFKAIDSILYLFITMER
ncbi:RNA polymerase sigma-70 factor [Flavobacterium sp.]|uniref:RNA polymerase sigma-70 factor n=1 Tax=Flavobacterium sp. TaxID=239 RepID=UPI00263A22DB|nr:RNA polymerase sigma-70 factor [Flavobacterium sp.]